MAYQTEAVMRIATIVAQSSGVSGAELLGTSRARRVSEPRQEVMWLARQITDHSLPAIGRALHRDHTSILHGIAVVDRKAAADPFYRQHLDRLKEFARQNLGAVQPLRRPVLYTTDPR